MDIKREHIGKNPFLNEKKKKKKKTKYLLIPNVWACVEKIKTYKI